MKQKTIISISEDIIRKAKEKQKNYIKEREKELKEIQYLKALIKILYRENIDLNAKILKYVYKEREKVFKDEMEGKQEKEKLLEILRLTDNENQELRNTLREYDKKNIKRLRHNENNRKWRKHHKEYTQRYNQIYWINKVLEEKGELINVK